MRALFYEFLNKSNLLNISSQFLVGGDILVTPVLDPNVTSASGKSAVSTSSRMF